MTNTPYSPEGLGPLPRDAQQERTRAALIASARAAFGRDGFHGARLDTIARDAGLTKGAIYSNFAGKAELFLAILEADLAQLDGETWDPVQRFALLDEVMAGGDWPGDMPEDLEQELGVGLATLEFAAYAARDPELRNKLRDLMGRMHEAFRTLAMQHHDADDPLTVNQLATLLMAFDHGAMITSLAGTGRIDATMASQMVQRVLQPPTPDSDD